MSGEEIVNEEKIVWAVIILCLIGAAAMAIYAVKTYPVIH